MACSLRNIINFGLLLAVIDLLHGVATCAFYGYQFGIHYRGHSNYGIRWYEHYLYLSDLSVRVNIGIAEGVGGLFFSTILIIGLCKRKPLVTWTWLLKPVAVIIINVFFLSRWMVQRVPLLPQLMGPLQQQPGKHLHLRRHWPYPRAVLRDALPPLHQRLLHLRDPQAACSQHRGRAECVISRGRSGAEGLCSRRTRGEESASRLSLSDGFKEFIAFLSFA
ncbi:uncharacterized protein LOC125040690 [Penaeus chinensis]|uniref:uncharacterized protein LOC125040690 n=1 Tax=Penaeus chinensis TaxID=139456 RepID=UPI001FB63114|nr:uncharacterized protein LOC125040690 [Penaeus chinensis]XP_047491335.1 uncharacterized protein LOC125040690 [Penaeus chinensis]